MFEAWQKGRWIVLGALAVAAITFAVHAFIGPSAPPTPLGWAPSSARIVGWVDVPAFLRSPLLEAWAPARRGPRPIERMCGFDPIERVDEIVLFVLGASDRPFDHVGFVARGELARGEARRAELIACVGHALSAEGRTGARQVEIEGEPALASAHGNTHAAFVADDAVIGGDRPVVAAAIRVLHGNAESAAADSDLARTWAQVAAEHQAVVVGRLPERWSEAFSGLGLVVGDDIAALGRIDTFGVGFDLSRALSISAVARATDRASAVQLVTALRSSFSNRATVDARENDVLLRLDLGAEDLPPVVDRLRAIAALFVEDR